jgi:Zn2+/Cd2+-exporting ATPase
LSYAFGSEGLSTAAHEVPVAARFAYALAAICGGWFIVPKAWYAVRAMRPDMNLLMTIAVVGAIVIGEWFEGATVAFLFSVSLALESWSVGRARRAVEALLDLAPPIARVRRGDSVLELPPDQVMVGSILLIRPGERIPLDGVVRLGTSHANQAPITGESVPVVKEPGGVVYAGTINGDGALEVETTKPAQDTTLAHIIKMVGEAQRKRGPAEQWVERFARIYTPAVLALAIAIAVLPPLVLGQPWGAWFYRALVLLVIGCPCALVISTPVTVVAGLAAAARQGVLIKGGAFLEAPARIKAVAVDKTGTLTAGKPRVTAVFPLAEHSEEELLARAAGMETHTDHPLAHAILMCAADRKVAPLPVTDFQVLQGKGATGRIDAREYWIGSHRYVEERGQETPDLHARLEQLSGAGQTVVVVGNDQHVCGLIAIADAVRPDARAVVQALHAAGVSPVVMLTGDNEPTARAIAVATGVDEVRAELLPEDKVKAVQELVARYGQVAMVGDGVNDAPAMATATLGIAMGAIGSDAAIETADVALMSDDLSKLPWLIRHSKRALGIIHMNIGLSLGVKALFVVLTFAGFASLWAAIAADMGVSLLVIANALRLLAADA